MTFSLPKHNRAKVPDDIIDDGTGAIYFFSTEKGGVRVIASYGDGWEHVSVSLQRRCPTWDEMCMVKDFFWGEEDTVIQYHPAKSEYINFHPFCLHLWRQMDTEIACPPKYMVGPDGGKDT